MTEGFVLAEKTINIKKPPRANTEGSLMARQKKPAVAGWGGLGGVGEAMDTTGQRCFGADDRSMEISVSVLGGVFFLIWVGGGIGVFDQS